MKTRFIIQSVALGGVFAVGAMSCAEKAVSPNANMSPRFSMRVVTAAPQSAIGKNLAIAAVYFSSVIDTQDDSFRILGSKIVPVTGSTQEVTLKVDITTCLADPTRLGSTSACTMRVGVFLVPDSVVDFQDPTKVAFDYVLSDPFDAAPGHAPTFAPMDLHTDAFLVNHWEPDQSLQLGGNATPQFFGGPISGVAGSGTAPPTLFAVTTGNDTTPNANSGQFQQLAINQNGIWRRVNGPQSSQFVDVAAFAANDVYIAASDGLYHFDGTTISAVTQVRDNLRSIAVSPPSVNGRFIAAGDINGSVWVGTPTNMVRVPTNTSGQIDAVCVTGANEAFALNRVSGNLFRFDGTAWTSVPAPTTSPRTDLQCTGPGAAFVFNQGGGPTGMLKWNGSGWSQGAGPATSGRSLNAAVVSSSEIYAVGDSANTNRAFYRFDGSTWREVGRTAFVNGLQPRPWADPRGGAYVASSQSNATRIEHVTASGPRLESYRPSLRDIAMPSPSSAFVVGTNMFLARLNGSAWTVDAAPAGSPLNQTLQGVWADSPSNAWAVGSGSTILHWDGTRWTALSDSRKPISTTDNYNAVWGSGGSIWIAGDATILRCRSATSCSPDQVAGTGAMYGIWGTSATDAYAVGANGRILHFDGSAWAQMPSPTGGRLSRLVGVASNNVFALGDTVVLHYDGKSWSNVTRGIFDSNQGSGFQLQPQNAFQLGGWIAGPKEIYVTGAFGGTQRGGLFGWDGVNSLDFVGRITGIAGAQGGCGIATSDGNSSRYVPMLFRGVGPTGCNASPFTPPSSWP